MSYFGDRKQAQDLVGRAVVRALMFCHNMIFVGPALTEV